MMMYARVAALLFLIALGFWVKNLWENNQELKAQNKEMLVQIERTAENMKLVIRQLDREIEYRQIAETALNDLKDEVPDDVYSQELPPEIQGVLDRFHDRISK